MLAFSKSEKKVRLRERFEYIKPVLEPFFYCKVAITEATIAALLNVAIYNKSANSCSLPNKFDHKIKLNKRRKSNREDFRTRLYCCFFIIGPLSAKGISIWHKKVQLTVIKIKFLRIVFYLCAIKVCRRQCVMAQLWHLIDINEKVTSIKKPKKTKLHNLSFFFQAFLFWKILSNSDCFSLVARFKPLGNFKSSKFSFCSASSVFLSDSKLYSLITSRNKNFCDLSV